MRGVQKALSGLTARVVLACCGLLLAAGPVLGGGEESRPVRIGVLAKRGPQRCLEEWGVTAEYLGAEIPGYRFEIRPLRYDEVAPVVEAGKVDFILANPALYVELERFHGASPIVTLRNLYAGKPYTVYAGVIICKSGREDIRELSELKGKTFMGVEEDSFGGWQMAWRELKKHGIDPYRDFSDLRFTNTHDAVVYAVRDGEVDAGTVRADTLAQMVLEGKVRWDQFQVINAQRGEEAILPFPHSTRTYPEWPLAKVRQTSDELAQKVAVALLRMSPESPAAKAAGCAGWVIPQNYEPVQDCLRELRIGPYQDYGEVTLEAAVRRYRPWLVGAVAILVFACVLFVYVARLNRALRDRLSQHRQELIERRRAEETIRLSETRLRQVIDLVPHMIFAKDRDGRFLLVNRTLAEAYDTTVEELTGKKHAEVHPIEEELRHMLADDLAVIESGQPKIVPQESFMDAEGNVRLLQVIKIPYTASGTSEPAMLGVAIDITELKQAEEALRKSEQMRAEAEKLAAIGRLAAGVAHEINNPLTGVLTFSHLLKDKQNMDEQDRKDLELIIHETTRAAEIVRGLLEFARERPPQKEPLNVNEVIRRTMRLLGKQEAFQHVALRESFQEDLPNVDGDMNQLQQVFVNLSLNACEAMPGGGTLTVSTMADDGRVLVKLTDTGCGIKKENLQRILEPFFSTKPVGQGTGLGLSVSYGIVRQHGGSLEVESEEGKGSTFTVVLPSLLGTLA